MALALAIMAVLDPAAAGLSSFALTGTTVGLLVVAVLSTRCRRRGELMFRGALMPLIASWIRAAKPALVTG